MSEEYVNYGGGMFHEVISPEAFLITSLIVVLFFLFIRSWRGRPSIFQDGGEYALHMGLVLFLSTLWHFWYGEASIYAYIDVSGFSWSDMDTWYFMAEEGTKSTDLGVEGVFINTYEITVASTFLIFGVIVPSFLFNMDIYTGIAETWLRLLSGIAAVLYALSPALIFGSNSNTTVSYFQALDFFFLIAFGFFAVALILNTINGGDVE
tara:strand:+ start:1228 stop:1851 length:624 start_codon:yes stop_codon:yes gene_type:complete